MSSGTRTVTVAPRPGADVTSTVNQGDPEAAGRANSVNGQETLEAPTHDTSVMKNPPMAKASINDSTQPVTQTASARAVSA